MQMLRKNEILTLEKLVNFPASRIFATGIIKDDLTGANMTGSGKDLRFVATKGGAEDWAIYVHWASNSEYFVKTQGDKISTDTYIRNCVPCTDEVLARYRK